MRRFPHSLQAAHDFWRPNRFGLKFYPAPGGGRRPFALICPGGAYRLVCSFLEGVPVARELNRRGYHAFVLYYRVKEKARWPAPREDLERAVREIYDHADDWNLDTHGWSLWGSSAGGHLAASYCTEGHDVPKPAALVLTYPVVTMGPLTHAGSRENLLGKAPSEEEIDLRSVEKHVDGSFPPAYIWCGAADSSVDPENSRMLARALEAAGVPHRLEIFEGVGHGVGLAKGTAAEPWLDHAVRFWNEQR